MRTLGKTVDLNAGLNRNYTELDPKYTDDMGEYELVTIANSTLMRLIGCCGREEFLEEQKENPNQDKLKKIKCPCIRI